MDMFVAVELEMGAALLEDVAGSRFRRLRDVQRERLTWVIVAEKGDAH